MKVKALLERLMKVNKSLYPYYYLETEAAPFISISFKTIDTNYKNLSPNTYAFRVEDRKLIFPYFESRKQNENS